MKPLLRSLEVIPFESGDEAFLLLRDREGIAADAQVPQPWGPLLALFDGTRTSRQIAAEYAARGGGRLPVEAVERLVGQLDAALLLQSPNFEARRLHVRNEYLALTRRPAAHSGASYPRDPDELRANLAKLFVAAAALDRPALPGGARVRGIVVPHIDFTRGGAVEALAYAQLEGHAFDVLVVLGIAHGGVRYPFCATTKDYDTPLGVCATDRTFLNALQARLGACILDEEFAHKEEHSVEFVAVFLQYLDESRQTRIVPFVCGGFFDEIRRGVSPSHNSDIRQFCIALRETVLAWEASGLSVGFVVSVDLAHVGSRFGDNTPVTAARREAIELADREFLASAQAGAAEALHAHIARDNNARNVDAHPALYTLLHAFPELRAQLLHYSQTFDAQANSLVSFAALTLYQP